MAKGLSPLLKARWESAKGRPRRRARPTESHTALRGVLVLGLTRLKYVEPGRPLSRANAHATLAFVARHSAMHLINRVFVSLFQVLSRTLSGMQESLQIQDALRHAAMLKIF